MSSPTLNEGTLPEGTNVWRRRRRTMAWALFGLIGLLMGVIWAVGFATSTAVIDGTIEENAAKVFGTPPGAAPTSEYDGLIAADTPLTIGFKGTWGKIPSDTPMFNVDLTGQSAGTFFTTVYLTNNPTGWSALQIEFRQVNLACSATTASDWASPDATSVMVVETEDAYATFNSLAPGGDYCIGVQATPKADDPNGTFMRRPSAATNPVAPEFAATLNRSA
jgi:hypothetical protein